MITKYLFFKSKLSYLNQLLDHLLLYFIPIFQHKNGVAKILTRILSNFIQEQVKKLILSRKSLIILYVSMIKLMP
jgi:hypothetical protein